MSQDTFGDSLSELLKFYANKPVEIQAPKGVNLTETVLGDNALGGTEEGLVVPPMSDEEYTTRPSYLNKLMDLAMQLTPNEENALE